MSKSLRLVVLLSAALLTAGCTTTPDGGQADDSSDANASPDPNGDDPSGHADRLEALRQAWLCQDGDVEVDDLNTSASDGLRCRNQVEVTSTHLVVTSFGIPNHDLESGPGCCAAEQSHTWRIPLEPTPDTDGDYEQAPLRGPVAVAVNGVPIYGPEDGPGGDAVASHHGLYEEDRQPIWLGLCHGHSGPGGEYHYHADAQCIHWHPAAGGSWTDYDWETHLDASQHSPLIGFAFDGYPIYGSYGWNDEGQIEEMTSSFRLASGATGYGGIADYEHVAGLGHLDECNGRTAATPEFPDGTYAYYSTRLNGQGDLGFPYFLLCYHGVAESDNFDTAAQGPPPGGPPPGGPR